MAPVEEPPDEYVYDPRDISGAALEATLDPAQWIIEQRLIHASSDKQLIYHSAPFQEDTEVTGFFRLVAWIAIDQPDTDFRAGVYEIDSQGGSVMLTADCIRARYRESLREAVLIDSREPLRYEFNRFTFTARLIRKGHRLRLVIGPVDSIHYQKNYNSGRAVADESIQDARAVTVRLFHDTAHPSVLYIPLGQSPE